MKMNRLKRLTALCAAAAMAFSLIGCGGKETKKDTQTKDYVYVPEYITIGEKSNLYDIQLCGNYLYYTEYSYDEETMMSETLMKKYSLDTGELSDYPLVLKENRSVSVYCLDEEENLYTMEYDWNSDDAQRFLCKYSAEGDELMNQEITEILEKNAENSYVNSILTDDAGHIYLGGDSVLRLFEADGTYDGEISIDNGWVQGIGTGKDGKVYVNFYDNASTSGGTVLAEADFDSKKLTQRYENFPMGNNSFLVKGIDGDFLVNDGTRVYEYKLKEQSGEELFSWLDSDINGSCVSYMNTLDDGRIFVVIRDWSSGTTEAALLKKTAASELVEKQQITIGALYDDQSLQAAAIDFNKQSTAYRVNIKTYMHTNGGEEISWDDAVTRLNSDITSSDCPDILDLSLLDTGRLMAKGVLEDLTPYLESSAVIGKEDFNQSILRGYTFSDKLACIPLTYTLMSVAGKASEVGADMGWTMDDLMAYAAEHPEAELFEGATKSSMLYSLLYANPTAFIDWETGECSFETDEFKKILEFVNAFPDEYSWSEQEMSTPLKLQAGNVLLEMASISELDDIQLYDAMFNEPVTYIGYPTEQGSGCYLSGSQMYGITAKSDNKDGAWAFVEFVLSKKPNDSFSWGLPSNEQYFEEMVEEKTHGEYILDENGEKILDENGEPIMEGASGIGMGDWDYTYHVVTQEEVARLRELIAAAEPSHNVNEEVISIINEEAEPFFQGQKSAEEVAAIIQSRVKIYVDENR